MADDGEQYTIEELQAFARLHRALDSGVCDSFEPVDVSSLPPGFPLHGPLCGCGPEVGYADTNQLCQHCGRHPEQHP